MSTPYEYIKQILSKSVSSPDKKKYISSFAYELGWHPSDEIHQLQLDDFEGTHLLVEHGLENTAVISFLSSGNEFRNLSKQQIERGLSISYNNLVDWQIFVDEDSVHYLYNRTNPYTIVRSEKIGHDNIEALRSYFFAQITSEKRNPNIVALDDAIINTIKNWQVNLRVLHPPKLENPNISTFFNAIFFVRALEDNLRYFRPDEWSESKSLLSIARNARVNKENTVNFQSILKKALNELGVKDIPSYLLTVSDLKPFDKLDSGICVNIIKDFYVNQTPYAYNFSLITKHALSQIYQRYVALFSEDETSQTTLFGGREIVVKEKSSELGAVYTPHYIAAFFSRYLKENLPPSKFKQIKAIDPACGSGVFLRALLELQCDPTKESLRKEKIVEIFENISGLDKDGNACQAAKLSITLLYVLLMDKLPEKLHILEGDAFLTLQNIDSEYDAVIANPPYILQEKQGQESIERMESVLSGHIKGKVNPYLAFVKIAVDILKPGGYGMFVIPHDFLISKNSGGIREFLFKNTWVRVLADLSSINVFDNVGSYVVLLIFQKRVEGVVDSPQATVLTCQDFVGQALEDLIENRISDTPYYKVYQVPQSRFSGESWLVLPPDEYKLEEKLHNFPRLSSIAEVREGIVTGADKILTRFKAEIPKDEKAIYIDYLHDKDINAYEEPRTVDKVFFYPYFKGEKIDEITLQNKFPKTWKYLCLNRPDLEKRSAVKKGRINWWFPHSLPAPDKILVPKIMTPHLNIVSKFGIDTTGKFGISRSPIIYLKEDVHNLQNLKFLLAVLNSSVAYWYISTHSNKYSSNYSLLEPRTLRNTPIPNPKDVDARVFTKLVNLVDKRILASGVKALNLEREIDSIVANLYKLSEEEKVMFGLD